MLTNATVTYGANRSSSYIHSIKPAKSTTWSVSDLVIPWFLYASASPAIKERCSLRFMGENHRTELSISATYKEFSSVLQPLWTTETMPGLIISDRPNNKILVKGSAGQELSTNDLTYFLLVVSACLIIPWWRGINMRHHLQQAALFQFFAKVV